MGSQTLGSIPLFNAKTATVPLGLPPFPPDPLAAQALLPERRTFTPQENRIIDAATCIQPTDPRPPIYDLMLEEGRTLPRIEAILMEAFAPRCRCRLPHLHLCLRQSHARCQGLEVWLQQRFFL